MSLRDLAALHARKIVENDTATGFAHSILLTSPEGVTVPIKGISNDISSQIDPETGLMVAGRTSTVALSRTTLKSLGMENPTGVSEKNKRPWVVEFMDVNGSMYKFKVTRQLPDRGLELTVLQLELLK